MSEMRFEHEPLLPRILDYQIDSDGGATFTIDPTTDASAIESTLAYFDHDEQSCRAYALRILRYGVNELHFFGEGITYDDVVGAYQKRYGEANAEMALLGTFREFADEGCFPQTKVKVNVSIQIDATHNFTIPTDDQIAEEMLRLTNHLYGFE